MLSACIGDGTTTYLVKASTGISGLTVFAKRFKLQEKQNKCNEIFYTIKSVQAICAVV